MLGPIYMEKIFVEHINVKSVVKNCNNDRR